MGKRELLLAVVFLVLGVVVYQVTAPAADPNRPAWSVGGIIERMRREIRGNQAHATANWARTIPAPDSVREVRLLTGSISVTVIGEDRSDIQASMDVASRAYDTAEAERTAKESHVKVDDAGSVITLTTWFPEAGRQTATLTVRVPSRLEVRAEKNGALDISNVAALVVSGRGQTTAKNIAGAVHAQQRGGTITLTDIGSLKLSSFGGADARLQNIRGDASLSLQGGDVYGAAIEGAIEIEARNSEIKLEKLEKARRPIRINSGGGEVAVLGVGTELRIDGRETDIRVEQAAPAMVSIYNDGDETVELAVPPGGFKIDAAAIDGRITVDEELEKTGVKVASSMTEGGETGRGRDEYRVQASVRGGGPMITIRARRGDIVLRSR